MAAAVFLTGSYFCHLCGLIKESYSPHIQPASVFRLKIKMMSLRWPRARCRLPTGAVTCRRRVLSWSLQTLIVLMTYEQSPHGV